MGHYVLILSKLSSDIPKTSEVFTVWKCPNRLRISSITRVSLLNFGFTFSGQVAFLPTLELWEVHESVHRPALARSSSILYIFHLRSSAAFTTFYWESLAAISRNQEDTTFLHGIHLFVVAYYLLYSFSFFHFLFLHHLLFSYFPKIMWKTLLFNFNTMRKGCHNQNYMPKLFNILNNFFPLLNIFGQNPLQNPLLHPLWIFIMPFPPLKKIFSKNFPSLYKGWRTLRLYSIDSSFH